MIAVVVGNQRADTDNRVIDMLRKLVAHCGADVVITLTIKTICGSKATQIGHCFEVPNNDAVHGSQFGIKEDVDPPRKSYMSDCIHCDIHDLIDSRLQGDEADLAEIASKVTEVLADLILLAPEGDQGKLMADILANLGMLVLQKGEEVSPDSDPRRH